MELTYQIDKIQGTVARAYLARIRGADDKWTFKRKFLKMNMTDNERSLKMNWNLGGHGVFELSVKWLDRTNGNVISHERMWFVYYRTKFYEIDYSEVLFSLFNLNKQYKNSRFQDGNCTCFSQELELRSYQAIGAIIIPSYGSISRRVQIEMTKNGVESMLVTLMKDKEDVIIPIPHGIMSSVGLSS